MDVSMNLDGRTATPELALYVCRPATFADHAIR